MAKLNFDYFNNENTYSDGNIENDILDIVEQKKDGKDLIDNYAVFYHLSSIRENILNWYQFKDQACVLEIGSGCGALTGLLCRKTKHVTAVELTERRALINFRRHQEMENLEIYVGNFHNIKLDKKFDYIILNGVFEYAVSFTNTEHPYVDFLYSLKKYLKDDGHILIAIENRMGLKYFSGSPEDHTGKLFSGLRGYENNDSARTFSKSEISELLKAAGFSKWQFYYPFPDYKFPAEMFTDASINNASYVRKESFYDNAGLYFFDESAIRNTMCAENIYDHFANSFLIDIGAKESQIEYAKISTERDKRFQIITKIQSDKSLNKKFVIKEALCPEAKHHIDKITVNSKKDMNQYVVNLRGDKISETAVRFDFLSSDTIETEIKKQLSNLNLTGVKKLIDDFHDNLFLDVFIKNNQYDKDKNFKQFFGSVHCDEPLYCKKNLNIDLIPENIFLQENSYIIIDCEWIMEFDVPVNFVIWRFLHALYEKLSDLEKYLPLEEILKKYQITKHQINIFVEWINFFSSTYVKGKKYPCKKEKLNFDMNEIYHQYLAQTRISNTLYIDTGNGFSNNQTLSNIVYLDGEDFKITFNLENCKNIKQIRWDPTENLLCKCMIKALISDNEIINFSINNSCMEKDGYQIFLTGDPSYLSDQLNNDNKWITIIGKFSVISYNEAIALLDELNRLN